MSLLTCAKNARSERDVDARPVIYPQKEREGIVAHCHQSEVVAVRMISPL